MDPSSAVFGVGWNGADEDAGSAPDTGRIELAEMGHSEREYGSSPSSSSEVRPLVPAGSPYQIVRAGGPERMEVSQGTAFNRSRQRSPGRSRLVMGRPGSSLLLRRK